MVKHFTIKRLKDYGERVCVIDGKKYRAKSSRQVNCFDHTRKEINQLRKKASNVKILDYFVDTSVKKNWLKLARSKNLLITDARTMPYDSPTGRAFIGLSKTPLMEVKEGFGYQGVLLQTDNRMFIQCHVCGKWLRQNQKTHLAKHNMTQDEYREKFGLFTTKALVSDEMSYSLERRAIIRNIKSPNTRDQLDGRRAKAIANKSHTKKIGKTEHDNLYDLCYRQLGFRLLNYINAYKILPSRGQKGEGGRIAKGLYNRHESLNNGFTHYELPTIYRQGTNVELKAHNGQQLFFNYNKNYNREEVYHWMLVNTPSLSEPNKFAD